MRVMRQRSGGVGSIPTSDVVQHLPFDSVAAWHGRPNAAIEQNLRMLQLQPAFRTFATGAKFGPEETEA